MRKLNTNIIAIVIVFATLVGCETESSSDVSQNRIYTAYGVLYDQAQELTIVNATFSLGNYNGTRLALADGASVSFNGSEIPFLDGLGYYELKLPGFVQEGMFSYTDTNGVVYRNDINISPINFNAETPVIIDRTKSFEIKWEGAAVGLGESSVVATVVPQNLGETKIFTQNAQGAETVILTPDVLGQIENAQNGLLVLERFEVTTPDDATDAGGLLTARYRPNALEIEIQ
ncbi:hypothetical protein FGM00_01335 [Aggregatimonas sangjinii]|uniref:Uncharacterized protein n=1 Tax=Aggregatimonas sangjinii TaxID=2583587 RepID=A0A5B7SP82_9FLAO|nr:hypothetical protein [Aggregatimonas sangjinii]QCW98827.1 hypothetical protein FGM00_01335 [Aggregatimonas sangjinii]